MSSFDEIGPILRMRPISETYMHPPLGPRGEYLSDLGRMVNGRYQLRTLLGDGGMGSVFRALDTASGKEVAVKLLHKELVHSHAQQQRFLREAEITRKLSHPNVVHTIELGNESGRPYLVMEIVQGETLAALISRGAIPPHESASIIRDICEGLLAIHAVQVVHRDVKPSNIIVNSDGRAVIMDLGVARNHDSTLTAPSELVGSAPYLPPESWVSTEVSEASDIYALGVVWYELCTGVLPFDGETAAELMQKHLEFSPVPPGQIVGGVPRWMGDLILSMLAKKPGARPASVSEVIAAIDRGLARKKPGRLSQKGTQEEAPEVERGSFFASFLSPPEERLVFPVDRWLIHWSAVVIATAAVVLLFAFVRVPAATLGAPQGLLVLALGGMALALPVALFGRRLLHRGWVIPAINLSLLLAGLLVGMATLRAHEAERMAGTVGSSLTTIGREQILAATAFHAVETSLLRLSHASFVVTVVKEGAHYESAPQGRNYLSGIISAMGLLSLLLWWNRRFIFSQSSSEAQRLLVLAVSAVGLLIFFEMLCVVPSLASQPILTAMVVGVPLPLSVIDVVRVVVVWGVLTAMVTRRVTKRV